MYVQVLQVDEVTKRCWNTAAQLIAAQTPVNEKNIAIISDEDGMMTICAITIQHQSFIL